MSHNHAAGIVLFSLILIGAAAYAYFAPTEDDK